MHTDNDLQEEIQTKQVMPSRANGTYHAKQKKLVAAKLKYITRMETVHGP